MRVLGALLVVLLAAVVQVELASVSGEVELPKLAQHLRHRRLPPPPPKTSRANFALTEWVNDQLLDHFDATNTATWRQRYFSNPEEYQEGGPIFIFIEGESEAESAWIESGQSYMNTMAKLFKAKQYVLEHRYFGQSRPTPDISSENLKYLNSDQALADLAYFIEHLTQKGDMTRGQKVAVFGGSYPGNLAAWARTKYPHLIHAAVASSAPVRAEEDFPEYYEVVTRSIRRIAGDDCADNLQQAFDRIKRLLMTTDGITQIQSKFYMCNPLNTTNKLDMDFFYELLASPFASAAQYNRDNSYASYSLKAQCRYMQGDNLSDDQAVDKLVDVFIASQGFIFGCVDWSYKANTEYLHSTRYTSSASRQWYYMTCTAFGYFQTADGDTCFAKGYFDVPYFEQMCKDAFGENYNHAMVQKGVNRTNIVFGSTSPDVTNVMYVNGDIDPWHALGVTEDVNPSSPAVLISGTSHCYDMYTDSRSDPPQLTAARRRIRQFLTDALYDSADSSAPTLAP